MLISGTKARKIVRRTEKVIVKGTTFAYPLAIKSGKGCYIQDVDGNWYLDFTSNVTSANVGYGHPEILKVLERYSKVGAHKIAGQDFYSEEQAALAEKLIKITPKNLTKVFLSNSGAEATENAIKFAYRMRGHLPGVSTIGAFHGRTLGALTFTFSKPVHKENFPELPHIRINFCTDENDPSIGKIEKVLSKRDVAFVIAEVIQGEGGYNIASKRFIKTLRNATKKHGVPLILDEVQTGLGRTGKWWGFENYGIKPDIIAVAKSLQVGATISSNKYAPTEPGTVSSTWGGGDRIDLAIGLKTIEIIEKEKLVKNSRRMGSYFLKMLEEIEEKYPKKLKNARGLGLMLAVDLPNSKMRDAIILKSFKEKLLLLGCGYRNIRFIPPLIIDKNLIDKGLDTFERVIKSTSI